MAPGSNLSTVNSSMSTIGAQAMTDDFARIVMPVTVLVGLMMVFGLLGNLGVLVVYKMKYPSCNFKYFVMFLAMIDMVACVTTLPGEIFFQQHWFSMPDSALWYCKLKTFCNGFTVFISAFILLLIAVDRFRKVCRPLAWQIKTPMAIKLCLMIFGIATILAIPAPILWGRETEMTVYKGTDVKITLCSKADSYKNTLWPSVFLYFIFFIPTLSFMIITCVLYGLIMHVIFCGALAMKNISSAEPEGKKFRMSRSTSATSQDDSKIVEYSAEDSVDMTLENTEDDSENEAPRPRSVSFAVERHKAKIKKVINAKKRLRRKTMIMFVLTLIFTVTTLLYFGILSVVTRNQHNFLLFSPEKTAILVFFWRLYFINHVINPVIYGCMDPRFRAAVKHMICPRRQEA